MWQLVSCCCRGGHFCIALVYKERRQAAYLWQPVSCCCIDHHNARTRHTGSGSARGRACCEIANINATGLRFLANGTREAADKFSDFSGLYNDTLVVVYLSYLFRAWDMSHDTKKRRIDGHAAACWIRLDPRQNSALKFSVLLCTPGVYT